MDIRRNFSLWGNTIFLLILFMLLTMQCKWTFTKRFPLATPQGICFMLWLVTKTRFFGSNSQAHYNNPIGPWFSNFHEPWRPSRLPTLVAPAHQWKYYPRKNNNITAKLPGERLCSWPPTEPLRSPVWETL